MSAAAKQDVIPRFRLNFHLHFKLLTEWGRPLTGAWIETNLPGEPHATNGVAPSPGRGSKRQHIAGNVGGRMSDLAGHSVKAALPFPAPKPPSPSSCKPFIGRLALIALPISRSPHVNPLLNLNSLRDR